MGNILIREASNKDLSGILRLNLDLFKKEFKEFDKSLNIKWTNSKEGRDYFSKRIVNKDSFVAVAICNEEIVGYICCGIHRSPIQIIKKAELENMMISEEFRGKGIGSKLAKEFFRWCKVKNIKKITVIASAKNLSGIRFYKKLGFDDYDLTLEKKI
ncbi:MAG: GNAT family N-acetyltransferase [Patescibacteria group bacterium]